MKVLVTYASRHGSTAGIAERITDTLNSRGHQAHVVPVEEVEELAGAEAVVIGAAAYMYHWLKPALKFARRHRDELSKLPVWLFSSGPLGTDTMEEGKDVLETSRPKEFDELVEHLQPRGDQVFFGAYDPEAEPIGMAERITRAMPAAKEALPAGDFRDWEAIDAWAGQIADELDAIAAG
ncbi:menaquinone-dependent protoporphyrinogen oxidase [Raineyella antarctica]|uniref:Menaquinone-dependent protoporphyrinogen oxidase n=1 Tax=Raineyella antarctica TaxID=1577474 RepID=A0A1G6I6P4_9ACTN|nr:flavodoxin domain-containing protein [Raineyella antarctica]SDC01705.1 menaquinone-dependent protoporphyrinogen oxidase [Raineyella antarctica]